MRFLRSRLAMVNGDGEEGVPFAHQTVGLSTLLTRISSSKVSFQPPIRCLRREKSCVFPDGARRQWLYHRTGELSAER
jgi:hypothetical protein